MQRRFLLALPIAALAVPRAATAEGSRGRFLCTDQDCGPYIYDPVKGDPPRGVKPGTTFTELPAEWTCPVCGAPRSSFIPYD